MLRCRLVGLVLLAGCFEEGGLDGATAQKAVEDAFAAANPAGRTGLELVGKTVWLGTEAFDKSCLESKNLAFNDDPGHRPPSSGPRISPTYDAQRYLTASSARGYCVYLGDSPTLTVDETSWGGDRYRVDATLSINNPTPWWECLLPDRKVRQFEVQVDEAGQATVVQDASLGQGGCPHPLPEGEVRGPGTATPKRAHAAPSRAEVVALATELDEALHGGDFAAVKDLTACFNLVDDKPFYGNCSIAEFLSVGPSFQGQPRPQDGTPWIEYALSSLEGIGRISADRTDSGLYHVAVKHKRTGKARSFSVKWAADRWKMVGVVGQKAEGLTTVRYLNDLHRADLRDIFQRRLDGEEIDSRGEPLNPVQEAPQGEGGGVVTF